MRRSRKQKTPRLLTGGLVLVALVGEEQLGPPVLHRVDAVPVNSEDRALVGQKQARDEIGLGPIASPVFARKVLLPAEPRLVLASAGLMAVEVSHGGNAVQQRLAPIASTGAIQTNQPVNRVRGSHRELRRTVTNPTGEEVASIRFPKRLRSGNPKGFVELGLDAKHRIQRLVHVVDAGREVLPVRDAEAELARLVSDCGLCRVGANHTNARVHAMEEGAAVDAVDERDAVFERASTDSGLIVRQPDREETPGTVEKGASRFDNRTGTGKGFGASIPERVVIECHIGIGNGFANVVTVRRTEHREPLDPLDLSGVGVDGNPAQLDFLGENQFLGDFLHNTGQVMPSHFDSVLEVEVHDFMCHKLSGKRASGPISGGFADGNRNRRGKF
jgi:hypothetical protein